MPLFDFLYEQGMLTSATSFTPIVTGFGDSLYTFEGGMVTVIEMKGSIRRFSGESRDRNMRRLEGRLETWNKEKGTYVSFIHESDPSKVVAEIQSNQLPMRKTMNRFRMEDGNHLIDSRENLLAKTLKHDRLYMVIHTTTSCVDARKKKKNKTNTWGFRGAQSSHFYREVLDSHESSLKLFSDTLTNLAILHKTMQARDVVGLISEMWTRHDIGTSQFSLAGDQVNAIVDELVYRKTKDGWLPILNTSQATLPRLGEQIFTDKIYYPHNRDDTFIVRDHHQTALRMTKAPSGVNFAPYNGLRSEIPRDVPYRISIQFQSGVSGSSALGFKRIASFLLSATNPKNMEIARSVESLEALEDAGYTHMNMKVLIATWAKSQEDLERNVDRLSKAFSNWGNAGLTRIVEAPDQVSADSLPGSIIRGPGCFMPIQMISEILPLEVATSPWENGLLMRSGENQPYPIDPGDQSLINFHVYVLIGGTGRGKSVTMTDILKACIFRGGMDELPEVRYLDVGYTSKAMFAFLRYLLPDHQRDQIVHYVMQNTSDYAANPWDTPLGMEEQAPQEKAFLEDFVADVLTKSENMDGALVGLLQSLGKLLVSEAYRMMSRKGEYRRFYYDISDVMPTFADALYEYNIDAHVGISSWWELVDALYAQGNIKMAEVAQRYAVPNFSDLTNIMSNSTQINESYKDMAANGTKIIDYARTVLSTLIASYPVLAHETRLDFQQARIVGVDVQDVANGIEDTNLFYSLLQNVLSRGFMVDPDEIARLDMPDQYRGYHRQRLRELRARDKIFLFDELHRLSVGLDPTASPPPAMMRLMRWIKEVRKYGIKLLLSSQAVTHMPDEIKEDGMWSLLFNMGVGDKQQARLAELFNISEYGQDIMRDELNGPEAGKGAPCLFMANTNQGKIEQKIYVSTSPMELWAAPTNKDNLVLMQTLLEKVGDPVITALTLTRMFPTGSAGKEIDRIKRERDITEGQAVKLLIDRAEDLSVEIQKEQSAIIAA
jgi:intracellular multiplication protein IcmB